MVNFYSYARGAAHTLLLLVPAGLAVAQAPAISAVVPMANARAAAPGSPLTISFNLPLTTASAGALKVFSQQRGGLRTRAATPATVGGNTLSFGPGAVPFMPGETVSYTVTRAAASNGGTLAQPRVGQFTTAVGGVGTGNFRTGPATAVGSGPESVAVGDVDGDGDLDLLTANISANTVSVRLNNGGGTFSGSQNVAVGASPYAVAIGDVDGDGDLDFVTANYNTSPGTVSVRLNNGSGTFSGTQNVVVDYNTTDVTLGDVDGDGDLDLLAAEGNVNFGLGTVTIRTNDGSGTFSGSQAVTVGYFPFKVVLGDVDGDGDLDLLAANRGNSNFPSSRSTVSVRFNNGSGTFSGSQDVAVGDVPSGLAVGDLDGDGDLDFITPDYGSQPGTVSVRFNNGSGTFSGSQTVAVDNEPYAVAIGDVNADGDLDFVTAHSSFSNAPGTVNVRLNNGGGAFSGRQSVVVGGSLSSVALGDVDGDGDLDAVVANRLLSAASGGIVGLCLNTMSLAARSGQLTERRTLSPNPALAGTFVRVSGVGAGASVEVRDALGRVLCSAMADASGTGHLALPASLRAGLYLVHSGGQAQRLVVE